MNFLDYYIPAIIVFGIMIASYGLGYFTGKDECKKEITK